MIGLCARDDFEETLMGVSVQIGVSKNDPFPIMTGNVDVAFNAIYRIMLENKVSSSNINVAPSNKVVPPSITHMDDTQHLIRC